MTDAESGSPLVLQRVCRGRAVERNRSKDGNLVAGLLFGGVSVGLLCQCWRG